MDNLRTLKEQIEQIRQRKQNRAISGQSCDGGFSLKKNIVGSESKTKVDPQQQGSGTLSQLLQRLERNDERKIIPLEQDYCRLTNGTGYEKQHQEEAVKVNQKDRKTTEETKIGGEQEIFQSKSTRPRERVLIKSNLRSPRKTEHDESHQNSDPTLKESFFSQILKISAKKSSNQSQDAKNISTDSEEFKEEFSRHFQFQKHGSSDNSKSDSNDGDFLQAEKVDFQKVEIPLKISDQDSDHNAEELMNFLQSVSHSTKNHTLQRTRAEPLNSGNLNRDQENLFPFQPNSEAQELQESDASQGEEGYSILSQTQSQIVLNLHTNQILDSARPRKSKTAAQTELHPELQKQLLKNQSLLDFRLTSDRNQVEAGLLMHPNGNEQTNSVERNHEFLNGVHSFRNREQLELLQDDLNFDYSDQNIHSFIEEFKDKDFSQAEVQELGQSDNSAINLQTQSREIGFNRLGAKPPTPNKYSREINQINFSSQEKNGANTQKYYLEREFSKLPDSEEEESEIEFEELQRLRQARTHKDVSANQRESQNLQKKLPHDSNSNSKPGNRVKITKGYYEKTESTDLKNSSSIQHIGSGPVQTLSRSISRSSSQISETSSEGKENSPNKNQNKTSVHKEANQKMYEFIIDMFPEEYSGKMPIAIKKVAKQISHYFGYSKSEKLSLVEFLGESLNLDTNQEVEISDLVSLIPKQEMINTFFLRGALNTKFRLKVEEIRTRFMPQEEVMLETADLISKLKAKEKILNSREAALKKGLAQEKRLLMEELERKRVKIELGVSRQLKDLETRLDELAKSKTAQLAQLRKDFLNTKRRSELLNEEKLKLQSTIDKLKSDLSAKKKTQTTKEKKNQAKKDSQIPKNLQEIAKNSLREEKYTQCNLIRNFEIIEEQSKVEKKLNAIPNESKSCLIPQVTENNRETLVLKLLEYHADSIEFIKERVDQANLPATRKHMSEHDKITLSNLGLSPGKLESIERNLSSKSLLALVDYTIHSISKSEKLRQLQSSIFEQSKISKYLLQSESIYTALLKKTDLVEELDKLKILSMREIQELLQGLATQLIQKKSQVIEQFLWSLKDMTNSEPQPSF